MVKQSAYNRLFEVPKKKTKAERLDELFEMSYKEYLGLARTYDIELADKQQRVDFIFELTKICNKYKAKKMEIENE